MNAHVYYYFLREEYNKIKLPLATLDKLVP